MTRKDYVKLAEALRYARGHALAGTNAAAELVGVMAATEYVANACTEDNPRFDRTHFLAVVCGVRGLNSRPPRSRREQGAGDHLWTGTEFVPGISNR